MVEKEGVNNYLGELAAQLVAMGSGTRHTRVLLVFDATSPVRALLKFRKAHHRWKLNYYASALLDAFDKLAEQCDV